MKHILYFLATLLITVATAFIVSNWLGGFDSSGYVLIGIGTWSLETSLVVFTVSLIIGFYVFYMFFRSLGWLFRLPGRLKQRGRNVKFNRSQEALIAGLVDSAEGNWEKAEKVLIKHASHSGAPLIHYLTAARAAQSRGALDKRDEYLKQASNQVPGADVVVGLTQAELHLSGNQFEQALETLAKLHSIDPTHASVLKLLHQAYQRVGDWEGVRKLIPSLNANKVLMEAEIKLLETETFSNLLRQAASQKDISACEELWSGMPDYIKSVSGVSAIYFAAMIGSGAGSKIEQELAKAVSKSWNETLLELFGCIESDDIFKQIEMAEQWLNLHPNNSVLLNVLGKLNLKSGNNDNAEAYLLRSIAIEPSVQAYQLLGDLSYLQGNKDKGGDYYKQGLELASNKVVQRVEAIS